jgi:Mrp family chromosome partitioning ATPase
VVFVAAPPLETGEDGGTLVAASDAAIFVTWDDVNRDELEHRREEMERLGTPLLGVVVLHRDPPPPGEHWEVRSAEGSEEEAAVWAPADG